MKRYRFSIPISLSRHTTHTLYTLPHPNPHPFGELNRSRTAAIRGATKALATMTLEGAAEIERSMKLPPAERRELATAMRRELTSVDVV